MRSHAILTGGTLLRAISKVFVDITRSYSGWNTRLDVNLWGEGDIDIFATRRIEETGFKNVLYMLCSSLRSTIGGRFSINQTHGLSHRNYERTTRMRDVHPIDIDLEPPSGIHMVKKIDWIYVTPTVEHEQKLQVDRARWGLDSESVAESMRRETLQVVRKHITDEFDLSMCKFLFDGDRIEYVGEVPLLNNFQGRARINIEVKARLVESRICSTLDDGDVCWFRSLCTYDLPLSFLRGFCQRQCKRYHKYACRGFTVENREEFHKAMVKAVRYDHPDVHVRGRFVRKDGTWDTNDVYKGDPECCRKPRIGKRVHIEEHDGLSGNSWQYSPCHVYNKFKSMQSHKEILVVSEEELKRCPWYGFYLVITRTNPSMYVSGIDERHLS
jgi:hypothetical protein